ncbi:MAG: carboxypeptidase regulatory-like domain-containing protein [Acidobacteria bacterium]|nr:carboxypeptidase regulatory-like domain-containing protein [Acidobacteriota bacterium]
MKQNQMFAGCAKIFSFILSIVLGSNLPVFGFRIAPPKISVQSRPVISERFAPSACPGPGLLISEVLTNPAGNDSPFEFVELRATRPINFATTPYSVVFNNNGTANANGWIAGGSISYGFSITTGSVNTGDVVYVGGSSMVPTGPKLRTINTATTAGDGFGTAAAGGVLGNGGTNADGVAVFDVAIGSLTNSTVPVDAIFFGTGTGAAVVAGGTAGYQLPVNDRYSGGKLQSTSFLAPDPASDQFTVATGTYDLGGCTFTTPRTWANSTTLTDGTSTVSLTVPNAPTIGENTASPLIDLPATGAGFASGVIGDSNDPLQTLGADFTINDVDTPVNSLTVTASSSNQTVVPNANLVLSGGGANRNLKITPAAAGYAAITVTVSDGGLSNSYVINYAASAASNTSASTRWHTGKSDASTAVAVDADYMFVADDEDQVLRLYARNNSGLPLAGFDFTGSLGLTDISGGVPREVDIEASAQSGNRIYWLGSHSNSATGLDRPNRARLFATDLSGSGTGATLAYAGRYDGLKNDLINWDASNAHGLGANFFGFAASAAVGVIPEAPDGSGFNIEGLVFAPDNSTAYIAFRAPIVPASSRTKALLVPVTNIASLVTGNPAAGPAAFGAPIQLNLGGRGIREIKKNAANEYLIVAGDAGPLGNFATYSWTGNPADAPVLRSSILTGLNPEAIVDVPAGLNNFLPQAAVPVELLSDNGDDVYYGDGIAAKDLANNEFKKFRSDVVTVPAAVPTAAGVSVKGRVADPAGRAVANALVSVTDAATGATRTVRTNSFGNFSVAELAAGAVYIFQVRARSLSFAPQVLTISDDLGGLDFTAEP